MMTMIICIIATIIIGYDIFSSKPLLKHSLVIIDDSKLSWYQDDVTSDSCKKDQFFRSNH